MDIKLELTEAVRSMLLPMLHEKEGECIDAVIEILDNDHIQPSAYIEFLRVKYDIWATDKQLDPTLKKIISKVLTLGNPDLEIGIDPGYFDIHTKLISKPFFNFSIGTIMLSHLRLIVHLAADQKMSSAKIAKVLKSIDHRVSFISWKDVQSILKPFAIQPQLDLGNAKNLYAADQRLEEEYFADATMEDALYQIGEVAKQLQFSDDAADLLRILSAAGKVHLPYLQILHYQCLISGFYDHAITILYEFNPRGNTANWLFSEWNALLHTSNPILNNAKAVDVLDMNWARSRKPAEYEQATVLVALLKALDGMGFSAAQQLTSWIRRWLVRYIKLNSQTIVPLSRALPLLEVRKILDFIKSGPTSTYGILEQRYVDAIAAVINKKEDDWRSRGLSDSVNSNNLSKRKLGDCDFQNSNELSIRAYEAHGGTLSRIYFEGHVRTFRRSLEKRRDELETIADIDKWQIEVIFVAYDFEPNLPESFEVENLTVTCTFIKFRDLLEQIDPDSQDFNSAFNSLFIDILNDRRTPAHVREKIRAIIA